MNNKGFTLIELLAVIVILAIIALIATPIIINIITDARTQAKKRSAELVYTGVQYAYTSSLYSSTNGTTLSTEPTAAQLATNFTVENTMINPTGTPEQAGEVTTQATSFKVKTSDGAWCTVTVTAAAQNVKYDVKVKCGTTDGGEDLFAEKSVISAAVTQQSQEP